VTVRLGGTPANFTAKNRVKPYKQPIRLYLVQNAIADKVRTRFDPRLSFIGQIVPDKNVKGILSFRVPPLHTDDYAAAAWCPGCARSSSGRTFFPLPVGDDIVPGFRPLMLLHVDRGSRVRGEARPGQRRCLFRARAAGG
jgi:hypothetical protein